MRHLRTTLLAILAFALIGAPLTACASDDDATARPAAVKSPTDGKLYCPWVENPHECDDSTYPAAPFAMPTERPDQNRDHLSTTDFLLLMLLFDHHTTYAPFYGGGGYYNSRIAPAWDRYPGTYYAAPGRTTIHHVTINNYQTGARDFDRRYATEEKANQGKAEYKTARGKTYSGNQVPQKAFTGTNVPPNPGNSAPSVGSKTVNPKTGLSSKSSSAGSRSSSTSRSSSSGGRR